MAGFNQPYVLETYHVEILSYNIFLKTLSTAYSKQTPAVTMPIHNLTSNSKQNIAIINTTKPRSTNPTIITEHMCVCMHACILKGRK